MSELGAVLRLDVLDFGRMGSERLARLATRCGLRAWMGPCCCTVPT